MITVHLTNRRAVKIEHAIKGYLHRSIKGNQHEANRVAAV
jgi:hypothetical protein